MMYSSLSQELVDALRISAGPENVFTSSAELNAVNHDESGLTGQPELVIKACSTEQISAILAMAHKHNFPVTPRGAGTGLAGGAAPIHGGVLLDMRSMDNVLSVDPENMLIEVQSGALTKEVRTAAAQHGLFYPPDPASLDTSTIGGNVATNAGGPMCVKYGVTGDYVLGLEAVLPSGEIIRTGVKTRKGVVGFDLTSLLVGSEGVLAVITAITLKLAPMPAAVRGMVAVFQDMNAAMRCVTAIITGGHDPSAIEFLDHRCLSLVGDMLPFPVPGERPALLLIEVDGKTDDVARNISSIGDVCKEHGATGLLHAKDDAEREQLWHVRRQVSVRIHETAAIYVPEDIAVPIGRIAALVERLPALEQEYGIVIYAFGHAGDGNIHLNFTTDSKDKADDMEACVKKALGITLELEGTISGEHGVGLAKQRFLPMELSSEVIELQKTIKRAFDPNNILNPGKIFPTETI